MQTLKSKANDIRMPYSLIRNDYSTRFQTGQKIFLKSVKKDKKNKKDLYIGSTEKSNIMGENVDEIFDSFELLEKRDRWSMDNRKVDKLDGIISKEQGIIFHIGGNVNNLLASLYI